MTIKYKDIFYYPFERRIPPVAKVNETSEDVIATELKEYVITEPIEDALFDFLDIYGGSRTSKTDEIGVWISGFYGSGKSHFAKILSYILDNPKIGKSFARELFIKRLTDNPRRHDLERLIHRVGMINSQVLMFDIKSKQDQLGASSSISEIMYSQYLENRGLSTDHGIASFEISLIEKNLYADFKKEIKEQTGNPWEKEREDFLFIHPTAAKALQKVAPDSFRTREEALASIDTIDKHQHLSISDLAKKLVSYVDQLAQKGDPESPPKLVFIMDEIGQFIGDDKQKLLELQSIVEEFGIQGKGKLWVIITAQAKLNEIITSVSAVKEEFGKIGDRFDTRLSLTAEDVEKVLEDRILLKKKEQQENIKEFYQKHQGFLANLASLPGSSRELTPMSEDRFISNTPFLPYQPPLIQAIFDNIKYDTAIGFHITPEARSMIGMAQGILKNPKNGFIDGKLGLIVSLDMVYDQIEVDIQPEDKQEINQLAEQLANYKTIDSRVLKVIYLLQELPWISVTSETLAHGLMHDIEKESLKTLKGQILDSLARLKEAKYVVEPEPDVWEFLTGAKKSFEEEASTIHVREFDIRREMRRILDSDILNSLGKINYQNGKRIFEITVKGDDQIVSEGEGMILDVKSPIYREFDRDFSIDEVEQVLSFTDKNTVFWIAGESPSLKEKLKRKIQLKEILNKWNAKQSKTDEEREIIREKTSELNTLQREIVRQTEKSLNEGVTIWNGHVDELDGTTSNLKTISINQLSPIVPHVFPKFEIGSIKPQEGEIEAILSVPQNQLPHFGARLDLFDGKGHLNQHSRIVGEVSSELKRRMDLGGDLSGKSIESHFSGGDYGWSNEVIRLVMAALFRAGLIIIKDGNITYTDYTSEQAQNFITKTRSFRNAVFEYQPEGHISPNELKETQQNLKLIFDVLPRQDTANALAETIKREMKEWETKSEALIFQLRPIDFPLPDILLGDQELIQKVINFSQPALVVKAFLEHSDEIKNWKQEIYTLNEFVNKGYLSDYHRAKNLLSEFEKFNERNIKALLTKENIERASRLSDILQSDEISHLKGELRTILIAVKEEFRKKYFTSHQIISEDAESGLVALAKYGVENPSLTFKPHEIQWDSDALTCLKCRSALKELLLLKDALPTQIAEAKTEYLAKHRVAEIDSKQKNKSTTIKLINIVPSLNVQNNEDLEELLKTVGEAIKKALIDHDIVKLE